MAKIVYATEALEDFDRILDFYAAAGAPVGLEMVERIREVVERLSHHPFLGRPVEEGMRELVISRGKTGFVALYDYLDADDLIVVLAIRHQREEGYPER